jgi:hypothetical protein
MNDVRAKVNSLAGHASKLLGTGDPQLLPIANLEAAGELLEECYRLMPDQAGVLFNVGHIRDELSLAHGGPFVSMELYERSLAKRITPAALLNKARILDLQDNQHFDALWLYRRAVIQQGLYRGTMGFANCMLMCACRTDDPQLWQEGWYWFEHRIGKAEMKDHPGTWRGEDLKGKRLLIYTDFGLGDQIWGMRWIKKAKEERGAETIVICGPEMQRLYEAQSYVDKAIVQGGAEGLDIDYLTAVMSMGTYMDPTSRSKSIDPYISVPFVRIAHRRKRVGVAWQGSVTRGYPSWRNVPVQQLLEALPQDASIEYVSLQKEPPLDMKYESSLLDAVSITHCKDLYDTAQLICSCDLVVTIGSVLSMLAPALGVHTWLLNTHNSAWQFGPNDRPVDWFDNRIRRFYQRDQGDWRRVLWELEPALRIWSAHGREPG